MKPFVYAAAVASGFLPGSRTLQLMRIDVRLVVEQFPTAVAPVPSVGNWVVAATAALALCAAMSDTFAGIRPQDVPGFVASQVAGALAAWLASRILLPAREPA